MKVKLTAQEILHLEQYLKAGTRNIRKEKRAKILLSLHQGLTQKQAAQQAGVCQATVTYLLNRYKQEDFNAIKALEEAPRPGRSRKIGSVEEAHITALACSKPPAGHSKWTLRLLRDQAVELRYIPVGVSPETIRSCLKKAHLSLG